MKYLSFLLSIYMLSALAYAGPDDRWVPAESVEEENVESVSVQAGKSTASSFDGIALLLAIGAFVWVYVIYRDVKGKKRRR